MSQAHKSYPIRAAALNLRMHDLRVATTILLRGIPEASSVSSQVTAVARWIIEEFGGDDGARTCIADRHGVATRGNCMSLRTRDLAIRQREATYFTDMVAPC